MAGEMDAIFIVGGKNSANTRRLADLAQKQRTPAFHIETAEELNSINIESYNRIGVSAGASTPNWIIDRVTNKIAETKNRKLKKNKIEKLQLAKKGQIMKINKVKQSKTQNPPKLIIKM